MSCTCCLECGEFYIANCKCHPKTCNCMPTHEANEEAYRWKNSYKTAEINHIMMRDKQRQAYAELSAYVNRLEEWIQEAHRDIGQWVSLACWQRREIEDPDRVHYCPHQRGIDKSKRIWSNYPIRRDRK